MSLEISVVQLVRNQNRLSSMADLEILSSFPRKEMHTKVGGNFVHTIRTPNLHYLESGCGRYGAGKEGPRIRKIWARLIFGNQVPFSPKEDLVQGKVEHAPRLPKVINTPPWEPKES
jgi:hypothetical protein